MGDDVEQLGRARRASSPYASQSRRSRSPRRSAGEAPAPRPGRRVGAAPRSSPPRRRRRGAAPARRGPSRSSATGEPSRKMTFGGKRSLWQIDLAAVGVTPGGGSSGQLVPVGRRLESGLGVVHPPQQRAELRAATSSSAGTGASAGSPSTNERTSRPRSSKPRTRGAPSKPTCLEMAEERVDVARCAARRAGARCRRRARRRSRRR